MPQVTFLPLNRIVEARAGDTILETALAQDAQIALTCKPCRACRIRGVEIHGVTQPFDALAGIGVAIAVHAALLVASLVRPERGLVDRVLGTRVVPK